MDIYLRELDRADLPVINRWRNDKNLINFLGAPFLFVNIEIDNKWFDSYLSNRTNNIRLAVCESVSHKLLGVVYLLQIDWINRSGELAGMIGDTTHQGIGVGFQGLLKIMEHAFNDLNLYRLHLKILANNERSIRLVKKAGFIEEGRLRKAIFKNGQYIDLICLSILKEDPNRPVENK